MKKPNIIAVVAAIPISLIGSATALSSPEARKASPALYCGVDPSHATPDQKKTAADIREEMIGTFIASNARFLTNRLVRGDRDTLTNFGTLVSGKTFALPKNPHRTNGYTTPQNIIRISGAANSPRFCFEPITITSDLANGGTSSQTWQVMRRVDGRVPAIHRVFGSGTGKINRLPDYFQGSRSGTIVTGPTPGPTPGPSPGPSAVTDAFAPNTANLTP